MTSLCPCSKEIADYGAHSQRGYVDDRGRRSALARRCAAGCGPRNCSPSATRPARRPIYPLLKRADERHVTMLAYDKPAFVEDLARDVAVALQC